MTYSESQKRATRKWNEENYERIYLAVPKDMKEQIKARYKAQGYNSMREYIIDAIKTKMEEVK